MKKDLAIFLMPFEFECGEGRNPEVLNEVQIREPG
tara:strand:- start:58 stop:162 length:105 start_codon:yes stop_codon:yes gene_type:complete